MWRFFTSLQVYSFTIQYVNGYQPFQTSSHFFSLLASELDGVFDLGHLQSLRVFAICTHISYWDWDDYSPPDVSTAFWWLLDVLKTIPTSNPLEEIVIKIVDLNSGEYQCLPPAFRGHFPWKNFEPLFTKQFPGLRKVKLLLQARHMMPILRGVVDLEHPLVIDLLQKGVLEIKELDTSGKYHFEAFLASSKIYF